MKYILCIVGLSFALAAQSQFVLEGKAVNFKNNTISLSYNDQTGKRINDTVLVEKGVFRFSGHIQEPTLASLTGKISNRSMDDPNTVTLFLEPTTMKVVVEEDKFKQAQVTGSQTQKEYAQLQASFIQLRNRWKTVMDTLSAVNKRSNFQYQEMKDWVLTPYTAEMDEIENDFFKHHPGSYVTAYYLRFKSRELSRDSLLVFYQKMPEKVKQSSFGKALFTEIEKKKIGVPGTEAKMFSSIDIDGKPLNLSDFKGKYVLVDFWASWCVPCRKGNPHLKELYATYKGKGFEVIGVSDDDRYPNAWKKAVAQDGLPWKHVLRGLKSTNGVFDRTNDISEDFNISSLPTQILIDPSGKIIGRYGDGGQPHNWLDSMLQSVFH